MAAGAGRRRSRAVSSPDFAQARGSGSRRASLTAGGGGPARRREAEELQEKGGETA